MALSIECEVGKMRVLGLIAQCSSEAAAYGRCVSATTRSKQELRRDLCAAEFNALKKCFTAAAKKVGM
ncbi:hypothetical protein GJAV_G00141290 [Gymnothorax javanicus]|nr:hypothetical protein GJAV_G00141290 [Gymnothorax javanicus]